MNPDLQPLSSMGALASLAPDWAETFSKNRFQPSFLLVDGFNPDNERILNTLSLYGVVVVQNFVHAIACARVRDEFLKIINDAETHGDPTFCKNGDSRFVRVLDTELNRAEFPAISENLYASRIQAIASQFYGRHRYFLNKELYLTHDINQMGFNGGWHIDPSRSLKFMLYLNDVSEINGAMMYVPGSNHQSIYRIHYHRYRGMDEFPVYLPDNEIPVGRVSLNGMAGSMVIFDTAGMHRAGAMQSGTERCIIRGHCYAQPTLN